MAVPVLSHSYAHFQPVTDLGPAVITGLSGTGVSGYWLDQYGQPRLMVLDYNWILQSNAGRWSSGDWQGDVDWYLEQRAAQGFTAFEVNSFGSTYLGGVYDNGRTYDGITPFVSGGDPQTGLNETYWARFDYILTRAAANGITVFLSVGFTYDTDVAGRALYGLTNTQLTAWGAAVGARYKDRENLAWMVGDDYFGVSDAKLTAILTGVRNSGDTHPISIEYTTEQDSLYYPNAGTTMGWGNTYADFNWIYTFMQSYCFVEYAYAESGGVPVMFGDGWWVGSGGDSEQLSRNHFWWVVASGGRGYQNGDWGIWQMDSGWRAYVTGGGAADWHGGQMKAAVAAFTGLAGWHQLAPATGAGFVTSGRGTRVPPGATGATYTGTTDNYVCASVTGDGTLAVLYCANAFTITIDESKMAAGYTAWKIDPASGAKTSVTAGSSYSSSGWGNNSAGGPDWVLALTG